MFERFRYPMMPSVVLILIALVLASCSTAAPSQQQAPAKAADTGAKAADPPALAGLQGADRDRVVALIEGAKKEGEVNWRATLVRDKSARVLAEDYRAYYGLPASFKVTYDTDMPGNDLISKTMTELGAGKLAADMISTGATSFLYDLLAKNELAKYDAPVYKSYGPATKAGIAEPGYWVADAYTFGPYWNTELVKDGIKTWDDFLNPAHKGKIVIMDIANSDIASGAYLAIRGVMGMAWWDKMASQKTMFVRNGTDLAVTGERPLGVGMPSRAYQKTEDGGPLGVSFPDKGLPLVPQPWVLTAKAPHPNAAKLWIDYIFSDRGQQLYQLNEQLFSGREGFVPPAKVAKWAPPIDKITVMPFNWKTHTTAQSMEAKKEAKALLDKYK